MKESITKFDLEAAFKALDDLEVPVAEKGICSNRAALNEIFKRKTKFDALFEEYYDISSAEELSDAQEAREAEVAKAKLARIEKIVDLDADSPDDLLASYVGKYIIQCPQCMTLFYKNQEDVETSEEDDSVVNVSEVCQHCGNESGYTLIGKVGAADDAPADDTSDVADLDMAEFTDEESTGEETTDEASEEEAGADTGAVDFDLDAELSVVEDEDTAEEDDTKEESFSNRNDGNYLLEQLNEDTDDELDVGKESDMDITDAEFAELMNSPEFSKPVSDKAAKAMLDNLDEAAVPSEELEEAVEAEETEDEALTEGRLGLLTKTIGKKLGQIGKKVAGNASKAIDKFADNTMTREEKADWVMHNTLKPEVKRVEIDNEGKVIPNEKDQKFDTYVVIGYKGYYSDGEPINMSPTRSNEDLVIGMPEPQFRKTYVEAEELAKGWSMDQKGGPAFILMTKGQDLNTNAYLCQFFRGELDTKQDKLEDYFKAAKQNLEGKAHISKGGGVKGGQSGPKSEVRQASALKVGDVIVLGKAQAKITKVSESKFQAGSWTIEVQDADGDTDTVTFKGTQKVTVILSTGDSEETTEAYVAKAASMTSIMEELDELNEEALEALISKSLVESYKNVAGFRLSRCEYLNESLNVYGNVFFESGCCRELSYKFTSAATKNGKVAFKGLNEKLGTGKNFYLVGKTDNKTFIAESFRQAKNN